MDEHTLFLFLIAGGVICVAAAIIGGGLSLHVVSIPAMSQTRQIILALFGLLIAAFGAFMYFQSGDSQEEAAPDNDPAKAEAPPSKE